MKRLTVSAGLVLVIILSAGSGPIIRADELTPEYKKAIAKGLEWVAGTQVKDGHWEGNGGQYPTAMTGLAGIALLMEGSTLREGKYADHLRRTVDWLLERAQPNGLIANPNEDHRYTYGHGYAVLFLAGVYGEEEDGDRRKKLENVLTKAVEFCGKAQTSRGGWGYVSAEDGNDFDEGSTTITQLQALRAARNAGIPVPKSIIDNAKKYLTESTTDRGSMIYSLARSNRREGGPALVAAAIAGSFNIGEYDSPLAKKWLGYCRSTIPLDGSETIGHSDYTHYYYAQALYILGEEGYAKLYPQSEPGDRLTWSRYRKAKFEALLKSQNNDGSWDNGNIGPIFCTAINLTILQLDKGTLPIYQR